MLKKICLSLSCVGALAAVSACQSDGPDIRRAEIWQPQISMPNAVVVCRSKQCSPTKLSMSREYIYNSLMHLLDNNTQTKALVCAADASSHVCTNPYLTLPITVGVTPANMYIDAVKISDISATLGTKSLNLLLNYYVTFNGQTPVCKPAQTLVYVKNADNIVMEDSGYSCKMTTIGNTTVKTLFAIDYIDLDYGYIGGYYSIGLSGPAFGGGSGYMLMRLEKDAYPLAPGLRDDTAEEAAIKEAQIRLAAEQLLEERRLAEEEKERLAKEAKAAAPSFRKNDAEKYGSTGCYKNNCRPAIDKKMIVKENLQANEQPVTEPAKNSYNLNGVQVFPLAPKKKDTPVSDKKAGENSSVKNEDKNVSKLKEFIEEAAPKVQNTESAEKSK